MFQRFWPKALASLALSIWVLSLLTAVSTAQTQYEKKFNMVGKLASLYQPYGVWYDDVTTAKSVAFIDLVKDLCEDINLSDEILVSCVVFHFDDKTSGAWADFNATLTSPTKGVLGQYDYSAMRKLLRANMTEAFDSVYQRIDHISPDIDRSWMMTLAVLTVGLVGGFCIVLGVVIAVRIVLEERRVAQASASKADLLKEYEDIKREKTRIKSKKRSGRQTGELA